MSAVRRLIRLLLAVSLALTAGEAWAQWNLPPDYSKDNDAQNPKDMRGGKGQGMRLLYYESFEGEQVRTTEGWGRMPKGWSQQWVPGTAGSQTTAYWVVEPGGGRPDTSASRTPYRPYDGEWNMLCYVNSTGTMQRLMTPVLDLSGGDISDPRLVFYYASPKDYRGFCRMRVQYRFGEDEWKDLADVEELQRADDWVPVSISLPPALREKAGLQIGFVSVQNYGYGTAIDEVYVVNMDGAETGVRTFDLIPQSPIIARGAKNVPLMRMDVTLTSGGGKLKLEGLNGKEEPNGPSIKVHAVDGSGQPLMKDALSNFRVFVGRGGKFSDAVEAAKLNVTGGTGTSYELKTFKITDHKALIMQGGNTYNVWIVADVNDVESTPYKTRIWVDVKESTIKFVWYKNDEDPNSLNGPKQSFFPAKGHSYETPEVQRSVVYKSLFFDDFEAGLGKWNRLSGATQQLWDVGNPKVGQGVTFPSGGKPREEQVKSAYSGDKVLATGELATGTGGELRARYFANMVSANNQDQCAWVEIKDKIQASQVKDVYLVMQKSFNTPSGMLLFVEGKYEGSTTWVEFARYNVSSSDWQGWQELPLRLSRADGREFNLRLRAFYPKNDVAHTGFIVDDFRILGNEVQNDVGITGLKVTESWDNGKGRKAAFTVRNYGVNTQKDIKYDVYVDGNLALGGQSLPGGNLAAGGSQPVVTEALEALKADVNRDNTHEIEVRLTLGTDEDMSNNVARVTTYSYPTIPVSDAKPYPENFGDPMHHWFGGEAYREGFKSSWLFNSVYSISKCRDNSGKQAGPFGEGMLLGSYIWTTGDHTAFGFEQSVLTSPVFEISTQDAKNRKEFVMAYTTQGENVEVQVEYRKENGDWQRLEKSAQWEKGWYDGSGAVWKGSTTEGYKIVKTLLPDDLQGVGGAVKAQFRVYFYNRSADRAPGIAVNGIEVRSVRSDIYVESIEPKGGCGNPLGNDETLRVTIAVKAEPAIAYGARKDFPVSIKVVRNGEKEYSVVRPVDLPALDPGQSHTVDTEVQLPWAAEWGKKSEVTVTLLPQSGENGEADEDVSNNVLTQPIEAKVPAVFPLKEIVKEEGGYVLYALMGNGLKLQTEPEQGSGYNGYTFSEFSIPGGSPIAAINNGTFTATGEGSIKLKYKVNGECEVELPVKIKKAQCDVTVERVEPVGDVNCKEEGEALAFKVTIKDKNQPSTAQNLRLVVTQGGREVYNGDAKLGEQTVEVTKARSGGGVLKFTAVADADMDGSNNTKVYEPEVLLYPKPLEVFLQDVSDPTYMLRVNDGSEQNTYGNRQWQLYVPKVSVIPEIKWTLRGYTMGSDKDGYIVRLGQASGEFVALATLSNGTAQCPEKKVFSVNVKNEDVEVQSLGGGTGAPGLCADAQGEYEVYVSLMNHSWVSYSPETWMGFELSGPNGEHATTVQVQLTDEWQPKVLLLLPLGKLPKELKDLAVGNAVSLKVKYLGVYDADRVELTPDANSANNEAVTELKLSSAPKVQWDVPDLKTEGNEYVVRKVFKDVPTVTGTLKVEGGDPAGMHYAWYSKSKRADAWTLQEGGVQGPGVYNITGIADDCYKVEVTNQAGCRSELEMRYIQTDLGFTSGKVMETPTESCSLTDNDGNVRLIFKNTGSKPLTSEEKFRVTFQVQVDGDLRTYTSDVMWFSPELEVNESRSELVKVENLSALIAEIQKKADADPKGEEKARLAFYNIELKDEGDWSVSGGAKKDRRKRVAGATVEEWGAPRPTVFLYTGVLGTELYQGNERNKKAKPVGPQEGFRKGQVEGIDNTYGDLVGLVSKAPGEKAKWLWHCTYTKFDKWPDVKLDYAVEDSVVSIPQAKQTDWMEQNKKQVGTTPEGEPKRPDGTYTVVVTGAHECVSRVQFSVADKAYDLKLESVRPPQDECDFKGKSTKVTVIVRNAGTMPIDPKAEIVLKLFRTDDVRSLTENWAKAAYTTFVGTAEGATTNISTHTIEKLNNGNALEPNGAVAIDVPVTLYYEATDTKGVVRSLLDGVTFEYSAEVMFANGDLFHEANAENNKSATKVAVRDISSPVVTGFNFEYNRKSFTFTGDRVFYQWDETRMGGKPLNVILGATTDKEGGAGRTWYLRGAMHKSGEESVTKITGATATVEGYGSAELVVSNNGCEGTGVFTIVGTGAALVVDRIEGIPDELCPDQVAGKRKLKVRVVNPTPTPIITETDGCGQGTKQEASVTLRLDGNALKMTPPKQLEATAFFGPAKDLYEGEEVSGVWRKGKKKAAGVGMSAFDTCVVEFDDVELNGTYLQPGIEGTIKVSLSGGCVDKGVIDSKDKKVKVNKSPDLSGVLKKNPLEQYALRGSAAAWEESWSSQQKLQEEMGWGKKDESSAIVRATVEPLGTDNRYKLKLSAAKPGTYVLKVTDKEKGCASSKEVEVQMPGFLTLAEGDAITLEPKDLLTGSCKYDKAAQTLKVKVVNNGNEPLKLAGKRTLIGFTYSKNGVSKRSSLDYTFDAGAADLGVGDEMEIDVSAPFKGVDFSGDGVYDLNFVLEKGASNPVDGAPNELRSVNPKSLTVKRYYQPTAKPDLVEQVKAWGGQGVDFKALPKDKKVLKLYGLAGDPKLVYGRPTSEEYNTLQKNGTMWTWYVDGEQVLGPAPIAYEKQFVIPQPDGIVKVMMQTKDGCSLESDAVEMRRLKEFKFGAVRLGKMSNSKCAEESSVDGTEQEVTGSFKLEMADVPLAEGTEIGLKCVYTQGSPNEEKKKEVSIVLDKEYKAGDLIPFKIKLPFKVGTNSVEILGGQYVESHSGKDWPIGRSTKREIFDVLAYPTLEREIDKEQKAYAKPYSIILPAVQPANEVEYSWESGPYAKSPDYSVDKSGGYSVRIKRSNGCILNGDVRVDFYFKYKISFSEGGIVKVIDAETGVEYQPGEQVIKDGAKVKIEPVANSGYQVLGAKVNGDVFDLGSVYPVLKDFDVEVLFDKAANPTPPGPNSVESELLREVVAVNPFTGVLRLYNAEDVESYALYNQLGNEVLRGVNASGGNVLDIDAAQLHEGVYVVRLRDSLGGERVLRVVKVRR